MVDQLSSVMEAKRKKAILNCFKWLAFVLCSSAFLWKTSDSIINYLDNDIGTKIILKRNYEADLPAFAICRHPNRYFFSSRTPVAKVLKVVIMLLLRMYFFVLIFFMFQNLIFQIIPSNPESYFFKKILSFPIYFVRFLISMII